MKFFFALSLLFAAILAVYATDNGLTTVVSWDRDSVVINGKRVFIYSGEFHYQRLPNPEMVMSTIALHFPEANEQSVDGRFAEVQGKWPECREVT